MLIYHFKLDLIIGSILVIELDQLVRLVLAHWLFFIILVCKLILILSWHQFENFDFDI